MNNYAILILTVWSCAEWGRVDGSSHPTSGKKFSIIGDFRQMCFKSMDFLRIYLLKNASEPLMS